MASNTNLCFSAIMAQNHFQYTPKPDQEAFCQFNSVFLSIQKNKLKETKNNSDKKVKKGKKSNSCKSVESSNEHSDLIESFIDSITDTLTFFDAYLKMLQDSTQKNKQKAIFAH